MYEMYSMLTNTVMPLSLTKERSNSLLDDLKDFFGMCEG